jgi:ectoine hydroxylase-related dioxygenase (phytanoyl-CoA dioxygenase family)
MHAAAENRVAPRRSSFVRAFMRMEYSCFRGDMVLSAKPKQIQPVQSWLVSYNREP